MFTDSERQTIQEVLEACRMHRKALNGTLEGSALKDIKDGLDISISKLETVLTAGDDGVKAVMEVIGCVDESALDDMVHDAASAIGSNVNNAGVEAQVRFLLGEGVLSDEILQAVKDATNE